MSLERGCATCQLRGWCGSRMGKKKSMDKTTDPQPSTENTGEANPILIGATE